MELFQSIIANIFPIPFPSQFTGCYQFSQRTFDRTDAERGAQFPDILLRETADLIHRGRSYSFKSGAPGLHQGKAIFKVFVSGQNGSQQILNKWDCIIGAFMPADLRLVKDIIIKVLIFAIFASSEIYLPT